jgi:ribosome-interacting GTPase 1
MSDANQNQVEQIAEQMGVSVEVAAKLADLDDEDIEQMVSESGIERKRLYPKEGITEIADVFRDFEEAIDELLTEQKQKDTGNKEFDGNYDSDQTEALMLLVEGMHGRTGRITRQTILKVFGAVIDEVDARDLPDEDENDE